MAQQQSRRTAPSRSLIEAVQAADIAYVGQARAAGERQASASESGLRGGGFRLTIEVTPEQVVFGPLPSGPQRIEGDTELPPRQRSPLEGPRFPPDELREEPYWNLAQPEGPHPVLVIAAEPPLVRRLRRDDNLPATVATLRSWAELPQEQRARAVLDALAQPGASPLAYISGFELLAQHADDLIGLADAFLDLPDRPGAATAGLLDQLYQHTARLQPAQRTALAERLVAALLREHEPAALLGYLTWLDAYADSLPAPLRATLSEEVDRIAQQTISGPDARAWQIRLEQQANSLRAKLGGTKGDA